MVKYSNLKGMCDPGEKISQTLKREFYEEAFQALDLELEKREYLEKIYNDFFENGTEVFIYIQIYLVLLSYKFQYSTIARSIKAMLMILETQVDMILSSFRFKYF